MKMVSTLTAFMQEKQPHQYQRKPKMKVRKTLNAKDGGVFKKSDPANGHRELSPDTEKQLHAAWGKNS